MYHKKRFCFARDIIKVNSLPKTQFNFLLGQLCFADPVWLTTLSGDSILMQFIQGVSPNTLKHDCDSDKNKST